MRAALRTETVIEAPAADVWDYLTDWPRQTEWIPLTRVEAVDSADALGGRFRAWTGLGPVGFWDTMTITGWMPLRNGSAQCEVLHTGRVVRGEGGCSVESLAETRTRFIWWERVDVPLPPLAWKALEPVAQRLLDTVVRRFARRAELNGRG